MASVVSEIKRPFYSMFIPRGGLSDHRTNDDEEKVEAFNAFFASIININDKSRGAQSDSEECRNSSSPFMDNEILRDRLYQLNIHKSVGPDWIHLRLLKKLADVMAGLHLIIYQRSWELGRSMLTVRGPVIPIYKKGVREDPANYRPVSSWKKYGKDHTLGAID